MDLAGNVIESKFSSFANDLWSCDVAFSITWSYKKTLIRKIRKEFEHYNKATVKHNFYDIMPNITSTLFWATGLIFVHYIIEIIIIIELLTWRKFTSSAIPHNPCSWLCIFSDALKFDRTILLHFVLAAILMSHYFDTEWRCWNKKNKITQVNILYEGNQVVFTYKHIMGGEGELEWKSWKGAILRKRIRKRMVVIVAIIITIINGNNEATLLLYQKWKCKAKVEKVIIECQTL